MALAIAALGLGALMAATSQGLGNLAAADKYIEATRRAQSRLATVGTLLPITPGEWSGNDDNGFRWRVEIRPLPGIDESLPFIPYAIEVDEGWQSGARTGWISVHSDRLGRPNG